LLIVSFVAQNRIHIIIKNIKMNYQETLDWMFAQLPMFQRKGQAAYKANLDNTLKLDAYFGHPHKSFKTVHVAGTNGKGSVSHFLASCLQEAGYKVGLYTSPHLKDFRERININGEHVSEQFVIDFIGDNEQLFSEIRPSFFEMTVAMAFNYFAQEEVDYAIIETGLGGRLDSTNIILPELSVITNISLDHTALLGDSLSQIALEKAGIIKAGIPVVVGEYQEEIASVFINKSEETSSQIRFADKELRVENSVASLKERALDIYRGNELRIKSLRSSLVGVYQEKNIITVLIALDNLRHSLEKLSDENILSGFKNVVKNTGMLGRWQILNEKPIIVCDTAHNEAGVKCVLEQLKSVAYNKLHIVFGMVNDKSIEMILSMMPKDATYYFTKASIPRALDENELERIAIKCDLYGKTYPDVTTAVVAAKEAAGEDDLIYIGGSTFIVAEVV